MATANEIVSMERAATAAPQSRVHLTPTIGAFTAQLDTGVRQYHEMVEAAAQLVSAANSGSMSSSPMSTQRYRQELGTATDRLAGWAQAFDELGHLRGA
jgi:mitochondrial fission protein ELM1